MVKTMNIFWSFKIKEGSRYKQKKKIGRTKKLFWGDKTIILKGQSYKFTYFKENLKTFGGTFVPPTLAVGPPLLVTKFT
jgi:hypothetical protein